MTFERTSLFGYVGMCLPTVSSSASLPASTSCSVATAVNILFMEPIRNFVSGVLGAAVLSVGTAPGVLEENLVVAGYEHRPGERACLRALPCARNE